MDDMFENSWANYPEDNDIAKDHFKAGWEAGYSAAIAQYSIDEGL